MEKCKANLARPACANRTLLNKVNELVDYANLGLSSVESAKAAESAAAAATEAAASAERAQNQTATALRYAVICPEKTGTNITVNDAANKPIENLILAGKTTHSHTPVIDNPATLVNACENGEVGVSITNTKNHTIITNIGAPLRGIPVSSGGNFTDANGQKWVCDEVDFARGVYVQRIGTKTIDTCSYYEASRQLVYASLAYYPEYGVFLPGLSESYVYDLSFFSNPRVGHFVIMTESSTAWEGYARAIFRIPEGVAADKAACNAWLADNNFTVLYPLHTPVETPIPDDVKAAFDAVILDKGLNNIVSNGPEMLFGYRVDNELFFNAGTASTEDTIMTPSIDVGEIPVLPLID